MVKFVLVGVKINVVRSFLFILLLPLLSFSQIIVDTTPQYKNVILEEFTGIHCTFCPDGHVIAQSIKDMYPDDVFVLNLHTGGYAIPSPGEPDFRVQENDSIATISNLAGYPAGTVNRHQFPMTQGGGTAMSRSDWLDAASEILYEMSYVNVGVLMQYDTVVHTLIIDVELYYTDSTPVDGFGLSPKNYLNVVLIQDSIPGPQTGALSYNPGAIINGPWQPTYSHQHMVREYLTGQWGEAVTTHTPVGPGHFIFQRIIYPIPNLPFINGIYADIDHIKAVAFVTENKLGEIITGASVGVGSAPLPPVAMVEIIPTLSNDVIYDIYGRVVTDVKKNTIYIKNNKKFIKF